MRYDNPERLEVIADWERLLPMVETNAAARWDWLWMVLPIRFGYPATVSPFAESSSTRRPATRRSPARLQQRLEPHRRVAGYSSYNPNLLSSQFPASLQDNFRTGWGYFNLTLPLLATLPGFDVLYRLVSSPARALDKSSGPAFFPANTCRSGRSGVTEACRCSPG